MTRKINLAPGEFYHIYNRGTDKRDVFNNDYDYERFLSLLYIANGSIPVDLKLQGSTLYKILEIDRGNNLVEICAYCLMPNHFHLIIREKNEGGISKFMQKLTTAYTMYFNKVCERDGSLFQGRFKAKHADSDNYLSYLIAYIHLNPVKLIDGSWKEKGVQNMAQAEVFLNKYRYSSYLDYSRNSSRSESKILNMSAMPHYNELPQDFRSSIKEWLNYSSLQGSTL